MSILSNSDLEEFVCFDKEKWNPKEQVFIDEGNQDNINPMGYDLRVGQTYYYSDLGTRPNKTEKEVNIKPGDLVLIRTLEAITMPEGSISALVLSKVSQVSRGLSKE